MKPSCHSAGCEEVLGSVAKQCLAYGGNQLPNDSVQRTALPLMRGVKLQKERP